MPPSILDKYRQQSEEYDPLITRLEEDSLSKYKDAYSDETNFTPSNAFLSSILRLAPMLVGMAVMGKKGAVVGGQAGAEGDKAYRGSLKEKLDASRKQSLIEAELNAQKAKEFRGDKRKAEDSALDAELKLDIEDRKDGRVKLRDKDTDLDKENAKREAFMIKLASAPTQDQRDRLTQTGIQLGYIDPGSNFDENTAKDAGLTDTPTTTGKPSAPKSTMGPEETLSSQKKQQELDKGNLAKTARDRQLAVGGTVLRPGEGVTDKTALVSSELARHYTSAIDGMQKLRNLAAKKGRLGRVFATSPAEIDTLTQSIVSALTDARSTGVEGSKAVGSEYKDVKVNIPTIYGSLTNLKDATNPFTPHMLETLDAQIKQFEEDALRNLAGFGYAPVDFKQEKDVDTAKQYLQENPEELISGYAAKHGLTVEQARSVLSAALGEK